MSAQDMTSDRLVNAEAEPQNWLTYSGQYSAQRFSRLEAINSDNVSRLELRWVRQLRTLSAVETTPLVVDGIMYASLPDDVVLALDARTGFSWPAPTWLS